MSIPDPSMGLVHPDGRPVDCYDEPWLATKKVDVRKMLGNPRGKIFKLLGDPDDYRPFNFRTGPLGVVLSKLDKPHLPPGEPWIWSGNKSQHVRDGKKTVKAHRILWEHIYGPPLEGRRVIRTQGDPNDLNVYLNFTTFLAEEPVDLDYNSLALAEDLHDKQITSWQEVLKHPDLDLYLEVSPLVLREILRQGGITDTEGAPI